MDRLTEFQRQVQDAIGPSYRILSELGGGGMSRVFLAEEVQVERKVVVKVLPPETSAAVSVERFEREIRLAARLQHPHIVPFLTTGGKGVLLFYVMPFIEGESLRAKLAREGELPIPEAVRILREVGLAALAGPEAGALAFLGCGVEGDVGALRRAGRTRRTARRRAGRRCTRGFGIHGGEHSAR